MIPVLAPLLTTLVSSGMNLLSTAIQAKGKEAVENLIGIKIPDNPSEADLHALKEAEIIHEEKLLALAIRKAELAIDQDRADNTNTDSARGMNTEIQLSANAVQTAKLMPYILDAVIILATLLLAGILFFQSIPVNNKELIYTALGSLLTMCGTILNFHRGTSASSKSKDETISALHRKGRGE